MPFEVKVESAALLTQFAEMQTRITELDQRLPQVFLDWQTQDMNRKYPKIDEHKGLSVTTLVYPRSRRPRVGPRNTKGGTRKTARSVPGVKRPILRPELVDQLFTRMVTMCREAIEWR